MSYYFLSFQDGSAERAESPEWCWYQMPPATCSTPICPPSKLDSMSPVSSPDVSISTGASLPAAGATFRPWCSSPEASSTEASLTPASDGTSSPSTDGNTSMLSLLTENTPYDSLQSYNFYQQQLQSAPVIPVSWTYMQPPAQPASVPAHTTCSPAYTTACYTSQLPQVSSYSPTESSTSSGYYSSSSFNYSPTQISSFDYSSSTSTLNSSPSYSSSTSPPSSPTGEPLNLSRPTPPCSSQPSSRTAVPLNLSRPAPKASTSAKGKRHEEMKRKPTITYVAMIAQALLSAPEGRMSLSDIYDHIMENVPFYRTTTLAWRNAVRHNLSVNEAFIRAGRTDVGRGHYWAIHPSCVMQFYRGDYSRRKAASKVQQSQREASAACEKHWTFFMNCYYFPCLVWLVLSMCVMFDFEVFLKVSCESSQIRNVTLYKLTPAYCA